MPPSRWLAGLVVAESHAVNARVRPVGNGPASAVALVLVAAACPARDAAPTWSRDVAPLVARHCLECHGPGAVSPPLATAADAARAAQAMARSVRRREMPPWGPDETGLCGTHVGARWLPADAVEAFGRWADRGAPIDVAVDATEDTAARRASIPAAPLAESRRSFAVSGAEFTPSLGAGATRCFMVPGPPQDFVARVISGDPRSRLVQSLWVATTETPLPASVDAPEGWACPARAPEGASLLASWSWTQPTLQLPLGAGIAVPAGRPLILQARADLVALGLSTPVRPQLDLAAGSGPPATLISLDATSRGGGPARTAGAELAGQVAVPSRLALRAVIPQLGARVGSLEVSVLHGGARTCAAYFGHWRPVQEHLYLRATPLTVEPGDVVLARCALRPGASGADPNEEDQEQRACGAVLVLSAPE